MTVRLDLGGERMFLCNMGGPPRDREARALDLISEVSDREATWSPCR